MLQIIKRLNELISTNNEMSKAEKEKADKKPARAWCRDA